MAESSLARGSGGSDRERISPPGDLDLASAPALLASVEEAVERTSAAVVLLDLSAVEFMDSTGLRSLLDAKDVCDRAERRLVVSGVGPGVQRMLEVSALADRFEIVDVSAEPPQ